MSVQKFLTWLSLAVLVFSLGLVAGSDMEHRLAGDCQKVSMFHPRLIHSEVRRG